MSWPVISQIVAWGVALWWCVRASATGRNIPRMADLRDEKWDRRPVAELTLTVVVPARDEAENIRATLEQLMLTDWPLMKVLAVNDRSTDATGAIMDEVAARFPERIVVMHIAELPEGWLGKTFALEAGTNNSWSDYLLFTDADVLFSPVVLRRALAYAETTAADHLVVLPTMQVKSRWEGMLLGFVQLFGTSAVRMWKVADPKAKRDVFGVGAFNLVRREALVKLGGWAPQRLAILEDITLGRRMKAAGMRQQVAFAPGLMLVHWAKGLRGLTGVMMKNMFSALQFNPLLVLLACLWIAIFCLVPIVELAWWPTILPGLLVLVCVAVTYRVMGTVSAIDERYGWMYPLGALVMMTVMVRSMVVVLRQGGVVWRGTHYSLEELRRHSSSG